MRQILSISIRFLLTIVIVLFIAVLIFSIFTWSVRYEPGRTFHPSHILSLFSTALSRLFPVCFIFALFFTFFFVKDIEKSVLFTSIVVTALAFVLFIGGYSVLKSRLPPLTVIEKRDPQPLFEKRITPINGDSQGETQQGMSALYTEKISGETAKTVVLTKNGAVNYLPEAHFVQGPDGTAVISNQEKIALPESNYWYAQMFGLPSLVDRFIKDIELANYQLHTYFNEDRTLFYLFSFSLLFFAVSAVFFSIHSRWQVFNIFLCFLLFRVLFLLNALSDSELMKEIGSVFSDISAAHTHILILLLVGAFFFIFHLLSLLRTKR